MAKNPEKANNVQINISLHYAQFWGMQGSVESASASSQDAQIVPPQKRAAKNMYANQKISDTSLAAALFDAGSGFVLTHSLIN